MAQADLRRSDSRTTMAETHDDLKRLDRQEWWRWVSVFVVTILLTAGVFVLSFPTLRRNFEEQRDLDIGVTGLFATVLLFDLFAVYQQNMIARLRRELTKQVAMSATLELLKPPDPKVQEGRSIHRRFPRFHFDQRVNITAVIEGKQIKTSGRSSDISEGGLGAVIPESFEPGTEVEVELSLGFGDTKLVAPATIRERRGFHHCIEFVELTPEQVQEIRRACAGTTPMVDVYRGPYGVLSRD